MRTKAERQAKQREWHRRKMANDPVYAENHRSRTRAWEAKKRLEDPEYRKRQRQSSARWQRLNPEKVKISQRKKYLRTKAVKKYGIDEAMFNAMSENQDHKCAICGKHANEQKKSMAIDHDHNTGKVRGLLCSSCNTALGNFNDSISNMKAAIGYLERHLTNS